DTSKFPKHYNDLSTFVQVYADIADGIDWDALYKGGKKENGLNFLGQAVIVKTLAIIQAECLNALEWCGATGAYSRPMVMDKKSGSQKPAPMSRSHEVKKVVKSFNFRICPACNDPADEDYLMQKKIAGFYIDPERKPRKLAYLYPLPKFM